MVADVAHELRTPVSNIRGWLEAVEDGLAEPDPELMVGLLEEATSLQHLIDDLQELSAADAGELRLYPEEVRLLDLLEYLAAAHRAAAERAGVTLTVSVDPDLVTWADPVRLRQAVGNLLANAIRHSPPTRTVAIIVTADAERVRIAVADEGPGIAARRPPLCLRALLEGGPLPRPPRRERQRPRPLDRPAPGRSPRWADRRRQPARRGRHLHDQAARQGRPPGGRRPRPARPRRTHARSPGTPVECRPGDSTEAPARTQRPTDRCWSSGATRRC